MDNIHEKIFFTEFADLNINKILSIYEELLESKDLSLLSFFFKKIHNIYLEMMLEERSEFTNQLSLILFNKLFLSKLNESELSKTLSDNINYFNTSIVGNHVWLNILSDNVPLLCNKNIEILMSLDKLDYKKDILLSDIKFNKKIGLQLDERIKDNIKNQIIINSIWFLFVIELLEKNKYLIDSFVNVYRSIEDIEAKLKTNLFNSLLTKNKENFLYALKKIYLEFESIERIEDIDLLNLFDKLISIRFPAFFDTENIEYNGVVYNRNFFFLRYQDIAGKNVTLFPFEQIELKNVHKIYDMYSKNYFTPSEHYGKLSLEDVYSFSKTITIDKIHDKIKNKIAVLSEDEIERLIRKVLNEEGQTPHTSIEIADIYSHKIRINNENDERNAAFILKGSSAKPQITLKTVAHQILKAFDLNADAIFIVFNTALADDAKNKFIEECKIRKKMFGIIDINDLTKLYMAYSYNMVEEYQ
ncbi:MAG: hypothetical protein AMQ22_00948 [Candidatus Methanofastidiosum methylothiophilum]|uniref:Uncharacterized protein n=1 Tax=Candidatus Methanofastidiosum methylothiophilum TaxID=1705564 RepID=A0A150J4N8_9EURY|nr:MAG: hypothetical protein AMQ22_00948 [Candidatus Methanofastidiosum methylthiophilus]